MAGLGTCSPVARLRHFLRIRNQAGLQLRWAIGHVLHTAMPDEIPQVYLEFARRLNTSDQVLSLNYDLLMERALEAVGLPYRRFPDRYSEVYDTFAVVDSDQPDELVLHKLHGSLDWTHFSGRDTDDKLGLESLVEGPRPEGDGLQRIAVISRSRLDDYYASPHSWYESPALIMNPSTAKPMSASPLIPLWDGLGRNAAMLGGFVVIGCSLPPGDPYVLQVAHAISTTYGANRGHVGAWWPQSRMKVVDRRSGRIATHQLRQRYRFMDSEHTDFLLDGFSTSSIERIFDA